MRQPSQVYFNQVTVDLGSHASTYFSNYSEAPSQRYWQYHDHNSNETYYITYNTNIDADKSPDYLPERNMTIEFLNDISVSVFGLCSFDVGSTSTTSTLINEQVVLPQVQANIGSDQQVTTTQGIYFSNKYFGHIV